VSENPAELVVVRDQTPSLAGFATASPALTLARGKAVADAAAPVIKELGLVKRIHQSFHVYFDGWTMVGAMVGVFPVTVRTWEIGKDEGYGANVEARSLGGQVVGAADAIVMRDEEVGGKQKWLEAPTFQVVSMAQTRAGGKALRQPLGWIMRLAGYEATPAEEMDEAAAARGETVSGGKGVAGGWRDIGEQIASHKRMDAYVAEHFGDGEWVAMFLDSKGYSRPLSKPQMADLRRAMDRELSEQSGADAGVASAPTEQPAPDPTSGTDPTRIGGQVAPGSAGASRGPTPAPSPSTPEQEAGNDAGRSGVEGANHDGKPERGDGPPSDAASTPPDPATPPGGRSGGRKGDAQ
jgi:hypothetical protein